MILRKKYGFLICFAALLLSSCLKDTAFTDVSHTQPIIEFTNGSAGLAGLGNFGTNSTIQQIDTAFAVNIASPQVLDYPVTVTLKLDTSYIAQFNALGGVQVVPLPDSTYSYTTTTITIPAGHRIGRIPITLYPSKIDPLPSYALPIAIVSAAGPAGQNLLVSGNAGVAIYTFIGNPLAGNYLQSFYRYNGPAATDTSGAPNSTTYTDEEIFLTPSSGTELVIPEDYLETFTGTGYILSFDNNNGVLSNFKVGLEDPAAVAAGGFTIATPPTIVQATIVGDGSTKYVGSTFRFYMDIINSAGNSRKVIDNFVKE